MATKKKIVIPNATAKLEEPLGRVNFEELVTVTRHQIDSIKLAGDYPTTPTVQAAVLTLASTTDALDKTVSEIGSKRAELAVLLGTRHTQHQALVRDRMLLRGVITAAAHGSPDAIKAWNCQVRAPASPVSSQDPPEHLALKNSKATPGAIEARCKAVKGAGSYLFAITTDPAAPATSGQIVTVTRSRCLLVGQPLGHVVYVRVAAVRKGQAEQSRWSEPTQILVR